MIIRLNEIIVGVGVWVNHAIGRIFAFFGIGDHYV